MRGFTKGLVLVAALALGACGSDSSSSNDGGGSEGFNRPEAQAYTEEQVADALGVQQTPDGIAWEDGQEQCVASVIMLTKDQIKLYADAGDAVATNPAGTVGVKVGTYQGVDQQMCFDRFQEKLKVLK